MRARRASHRSRAAYSNGPQRTGRLCARGPGDGPADVTRAARRQHPAFTFRWSSADARSASSWPHDKARTRPAVHGRRPAARGDAWRPVPPSRVDLSQRVSRDASRRVVEAQELERQRLARELHDETGQALTSILLGLKPLEEARQRRGAVGRLRGTRARRLDAAGRAPARGRASPEGARRLRARAGDRAAGRIVRRADGDPASTSRRRLGEERLPGDVETTLYRIVQEALTNVVKHAERGERQHRPDAQERHRSPPSSRTTARASTRRERVRRARPARACASGSRSSAASSRSSPRPARGRRSRGGAACK